MSRSTSPRSNSASRLFDPPSFDDLEYLPDPLGRLGMGTYVEKPDATDPQDWEDARAQWRDGASMSDLFGDRGFDLQAGVGAGQPNRRADVFRLQSLLHREGYLDADATDGPTGYWGGRDDEALRRFQKDNGLSVDGRAGPGGETMTAIHGFYQPRRQAASRSASLATQWNTLEKRGGDPTGRIEPIGLDGNEPPQPQLLDAAAPQEAPSMEVADGSKPILGLTVTGPELESPIHPAFRDLLHQKESGGRPGDGYDAEHDGAYGRYQLRRPALRDAGFMDDKGNWTGKEGVHSAAEFLRSRTAQEHALVDYMQKTEGYVSAQKVTPYIGQTIEGVKETFPVTESGLMAAAQRQGAGYLPPYFEFQKANGWKSNYNNIPDDVTKRIDELQKKLPSERRENAEVILRRIETRLREFSKMPYRSPGY